MFDDVAHIGRETNLSDFSDLFRTLSNNYISCKASTYPGVTKFGTGFDVYSDVTVMDVSRSEISYDFHTLFEEVTNKRFSVSLDDSKFGGSLTKADACKLMGQAVLGNMRAFIFACGQLVLSLNQNDKVTYNHLSESFKQLATNYFWPLLEEMEPKLGRCQPMVRPAKELAYLFFEKAGLKNERSVLILKEINQRLIKPLEILECAGFILRKEVSRAMKPRGRGTRYFLNLCNIAEYLDITESVVTKWGNGQDDSIEYHRGSELFELELPELSEEHDLEILSMGIEVLEKSNAYPYGLTTNLIETLKNNDIRTIEDLVSATDDELHSIHSIGVQAIKRLRSTVNQAIWM